MSDDLHAVVRGPSLTGAGALPFRTQSHHVLLPMGMSAGIGGFASGLPTICAMRRNAARDCVLLVCTVLPVLRWFRTVRIYLFFRPRETEQPANLASGELTRMSASIALLR